MKVLVIDDDVVSAEIAKCTLQHFGYEVRCEYDGIEGFEQIRTGEYSIVISDWDMPGMPGDELCRLVRQRNWSSYIFFILLTSHSDMGHLVQGLKAGADDFLVKPFEPEELIVRLRTGERVLSLQSRDVLLFTLAKLTESRDNETGLHLERMREYGRILAMELSGWSEFKDEVDGDYVQMLYLTSPLHDIGKVGVPDSVLLKPGKLSREEFEIMKRHPLIGGETLAAAVEVAPDAKYLQMARDIALYHHEKFDGSGYPYGLSGEDIPLCGRLIALADVYDALTSKRVYKEKFSTQKAKEIILEGTGTHFDPKIVEAFLAQEKAFVEVSNHLDASLADENHSSAESLFGIGEPLAAN
ncbi:HD domain-containing phosphohydrolase [Aeoliella mucimassa]|uniref:Cyclic di-GMP phosphodiesterase response regulator RpfG n=1 Tax=Aeoliella mucimassa TaxID=2527972 RepID=A0A518AT94_9BACT|nr:HD domain-containing phosphohydrolase [Aeoliella mucimassa]QDU57941.1 Cyclic di-GMP phosphodiesterase response regulator RpfG [Aeoliella mucimassa]